ncbi:transcription factor with AP2 domain(s), putative [Plasmodium ovale]|uniref:Transcription factor with AP2 domain(S), putative n=2 Tax=Plasmodium ovale TaxID=36330 RepID=A0A1D3TIE6_PLAOA|nr:transcription factor with AP2 domain(s), putative (ApiAP2) [Plasmodium ovale curtisi]SCP04719.1 transcription factor with AP2 domain(s), putative [Plasmodium ovale]
MTTDLNKRSLRTRRKKTMNSLYYNSDYSNDLNNEEPKGKTNIIKKNESLANKTREHQKKYVEMDVPNTGSSGVSNYGVSVSVSHSSGNGGDSCSKNLDAADDAFMSDINGASASGSGNAQFFPQQKKRELGEENNINDGSDDDNSGKMRNGKTNADIVNIKNEVKLENSPHKGEKHRSYANGSNVTGRAGYTRVKNVSNNNENNYAKMAEKLPHVVGVRFDKSQNRWLSGICINGRCINRYFPVYKYGFEEARRLAIQHRKNFETANLGHLKKQQGEAKTSHLNLLNINSQIPNGFKDIQGKNKLIFKYLSYDSIQKEWVVTYDYDNKVLVNKFPVDIYGYNNAYEMAVHCINKLSICNQEKMCKNVNKSEGKNEHTRQFKSDMRMLNSQNELNDEDADLTSRNDKLGKLIGMGGNSFIGGNNMNCINNGRMAMLHLENGEGGRGAGGNINGYHVDKKHKASFDSDPSSPVERSMVNDSRNFYKTDSPFLSNDVKIMNGIKRVNTNPLLLHNSSSIEEDLLQNCKSMKNIGVHGHFKKDPMYSNELGGTSYSLQNGSSFPVGENEANKVYLEDNKNFVNDAEKNNNLLVNTTTNMQSNVFKNFGEENGKLLQLLNGNFLNDEEKSAYNLLSNVIKRNNMTQSYDNSFLPQNEDENDRRDKKVTSFIENDHHEERVGDEHPFRGINNNTIFSNNDKMVGFGSISAETLMHDHHHIHPLLKHTDNEKDSRNFVNDGERFSDSTRFANPLQECSRNEKGENALPGSYERINNKEQQSSDLNDQKSEEERTSKIISETVNYENILNFNRMIKNILNSNNADNNEKIIKGINIIKNMTINDKLNVINYNQICNKQPANCTTKKDDNYISNIQELIRRNYEDYINYDDYFLVKNGEDDKEDKVDRIDNAEKTERIENVEKVDKADDLDSGSVAGELGIIPQEGGIQADEQDSKERCITTSCSVSDNPVKDATSRATDSGEAEGEISREGDENRFIKSDDLLSNEFNDVAFKLCPWKKGIQWNHIKNMWVCNLWDNDGKEITKHIYVKNKEGIEVGYNYCCKLRVNSFEFCLSNVLAKFPKLEEVSCDLENLCFVLTYNDNERVNFSFEEGLYKSFTNCVEHLNRQKSENGETPYDITRIVQGKEGGNGECGESGENHERSGSGGSCGYDFSEIDDLIREMNYIQFKKNISSRNCEQTKVAISIKPWARGIIWEEKMKKWIVFFKDKNKNLRISFFNPADYNCDVILAYNKCCEYFNQIKESNNFDENTEEFSESIRNFLKNIELDKIVDKKKNAGVDGAGGSGGGGVSKEDDDTKHHDNTNCHEDCEMENTMSISNHMDETNTREILRKFPFLEEATYHPSSTSQAEKNKCSHLDGSSDDISLSDYNEGKGNSQFNFKYALDGGEDKFTGGNNLHHHHRELYNNNMMSLLKYNQNAKKESSFMKNNENNDHNDENGACPSQDENRKYFQFDENNNFMLNNDYANDDRSYKMGYSGSENQKKGTTNIMNDYAYANNFFLEDGINQSLLHTRGVKNEMMFDPNFLLGANGSGNNAAECSTTSDLLNDANCGTSFGRAIGMGKYNDTNLLKESDITGLMSYGRNAESGSMGKDLRNYDKYVSMDSRSINKSSEKLDGFLENNVNVRLPKSEILNQAASLPKLQGMFFDKRRNYWTVSVCGFRKSFGVRTRGVYQAYKLAAEFRNRILETNKGKCYPQKSSSMTGNYKYNVKNSSGVVKDEKSNLMADTNTGISVATGGTTGSATGSVDDTYRKKTNSMCNLGSDKDLLYSCSERRSSFNLKDNSCINNNVSSNMYDYLLDKKISGVGSGNDLMKKDLASSTANSVCCDDNDADIMDDEKTGVGDKSVGCCNGLGDIVENSVDIGSNVDNGIGNNGVGIGRGCADSSLIALLNESVEVGMENRKSSFFKKGNNGNGHNVSSSNSAISNTGMTANYSPTHIYEVDNINNSHDFYIKSEDTRNDLSKSEDFKNRKCDNNFGESPFIKNYVNDNDSKGMLHNDVEIDIGFGVENNGTLSRNICNGSNENDKLHKMTASYSEHCRELYGSSLSGANFHPLHGSKTSNDESSNLLNKLTKQNLEEKLNLAYTNNTMMMSPSDDNFENSNKEEMFKTINMEAECNKMFNFSTVIDETTEERDVRIIKEVNKCKFVDGLIYDEANKCFRIKINGYRKAYSVIRRGVKEAYKLSIEAIQQIKKQTQLNNFPTSENAQIHSNNLTHFYNSSSDNSRHGSLCNYQHRNKQEQNNEYVDDLYDPFNDLSAALGEANKNVEGGTFPIMNVDDKYYELLKTAIIICLNDILMNCIPKVFHLYKNLIITKNTNLEHILNNERKRKEQSLKYHIEYTQKCTGASSLIPYLKLFSTEILNNILPSAQSLEIQRLIIHSLDLQTYNTFH